MRLVPLTPEARSVGASAGSAHAVAADAELLPGTAMASRARGRVDARLHAVIPSSGPGRDPPLWVRAARARALSNMVVIVAALAGVLGVARRAKARIRASLHRMPRHEACAVKTGQRDLVERKSRGERGDGPDPVASGAGALRVAARAKVTGARGSDSVLTQPVAVMNQVTYRRGILGREVLVAAVAGAKRPLILMLVATEARGHLGPDRVRVPLGHGLMATHAVAVRGSLMRAMLEAQVLPRESRTLPGVGGAVASEA